MYINIRQVAKILGISETQVRRLIKKGKIKAVNIGLGSKRKDYRIKRIDIESL